jgi:DNA topoisomerase-1
MSSDDDDDMPLAAMAVKTSKKRIKIQISPKKNQSDGGDDDDDDDDDDDNDDGDDGDYMDTPTSPVPSSSTKSSSGSKKKRKRENGGSNSKPEKVVSSSAKKKSKKATTTNGTTTTTTTTKELKKLDKSERLQYAMQSFLWWNAKEAPEGCQWSTMEHAGVSFPEPYEPHRVKMKYDGKPIQLTSVQEEA